jgi:hypothetical protein
MDGFRRQFMKQKQIVLRKTYSVFHSRFSELICFRILYVVSVTIVLMIVALPAFSQNQYGHYTPGSGGSMKMAILPSPGFAFENATLLFIPREFVDGSGNSMSYDNTGIANSTSVLWASEKKVLGARYAAAVAIPFVNFAGPRPLPGNDTTMGIGDIVLQPVTLEWIKGGLHTLWSYTLFVPTGSFTYGATDNRGSGFWSHMFTWAFTWVQGVEHPWHASIQVRWEIPTGVEGTDIWPGQVLYLEYGAGRKVGGHVDVCIVGYGTWQISKTTGSDFTGDTTKYRYAGIGPEVQWLAVNRSTWEMMIHARMYFEFSAFNAPRGTTGVLSFNFSIPKDG